METYATGTAQRPMRTLSDRRNGFGQIQPGDQVTVLAWRGQYRVQDNQGRRTLPMYRGALEAVVKLENSN